MLRNIVLYSAIAIGLAVLAAEGLRDFVVAGKPATASRTALKRPARMPAAASVPRTPARQAAQPEADFDDTLVVNAGPGGHYRVDAEVNGRALRLLVDTGASMVALSPDDAFDVGINPQQLDYTGRAKTANGIARMAPVMIDEIVIGDIRVRNVQGAVIDSPMETSLLGMSFLGRLSGFRIDGNRLILRR